MAVRTDWLPGRRELRLEMARNWISIVGSSTPPPWNIPEAEVLELTQLTTSAGAALDEAKSSQRTPVSTAKCKAAFEALTSKMRAMRNSYFRSPPLTETELVSLELKPKDMTHSPIPAPTAQAEADISRPGVHLIMLHLRPVSGSLPDPHRSSYGFRIYYGIMPPGGATVEAATGVKHELMQVPVTGEQLPFSRFTRRKKELFDFAPEDSGKTVFFCVRYENAKGDRGPWGPIFFTVIP